MRQHHGEVRQLVGQGIEAVGEAVLHLSQPELLHHPLAVIVVGAPLDESLENGILLMVVHQSQPAEVLQCEHDAPLSDSLAGLQPQLLQFEAALAGSEQRDGGEGVVAAPVAVSVQQRRQASDGRAARFVAGSLGDAGGACQILDGLVRDVAVRHVQVHQGRQVAADGTDELVRRYVSDVEAGEAGEAGQGEAEGPTEVPAACDLSVLRQTTPQPLTEITVTA